MDQQRDFAGATTVWEAAAGPVPLAAGAGAVAGGAGDGARRSGRPGHAAGTGALRPRPRALSARRRLQRRGADRCRASRTGLRSRRRAHPRAGRLERRRAGPARSGAPAGGAGRPAPARRAHQPPRSRDHALAGDVSPPARRDGARREPRPRVPPIGGGPRAAPRVGRRLRVYHGLRGLHPPARRAAAQPAARLRQAVPRPRGGGGLHPAQHRRTEQLPGQGPAAAAGAGEPPECAAGRRRRDGVAPRRG